VATVRSPFAISTQFERSEAMSDDDWNTKLEKLLKETEQLKARVEALEPKAAKVEFKVEHQGPIDWTQGMSMDRATMAEFAAAASAGGIANDSWRRLEPSSIIPQEGPKVEVVRGSGWQKERPLEMPPGVKIIDEMMAAEDIIWRRELAKKLEGK
jgi:hypothetical protein